MALSATRWYSQTCTGLNENTRYYGRVRAVNGTAFGPYAEASGFLATKNLVSIARNSDSITEGQNAVFTVTLHAAPDTDTSVTVVVKTVVGDYGVTQGSSHTVTVGTSGTGTLTLSTTDDSVVEEHGSITVRVHPAPTGWAKGEPNEISMTVLDNDRVDYDSDDDGLIEVDSLAKLNAVRWGLSGDGSVTDDSSTTNFDEAEAYLLAFPDPVVGMGCAFDHDGDSGTPERCIGYELTADLDFDENGDGSITSVDAAYWNGGEGWDPIGDSSDLLNTNPFDAVFEGNGYTISNLFINRAAIDNVGLFDTVALRGVVRNVGVADANVTGKDNVGALVGSNEGRLSASWATGSVTGEDNAGGLVGENVGGVVSASYAAVSVSGTGGSDVGGLVGENVGEIAASYATGPVTLASGNSNAGGLVGLNSDVIIASYSTGEVSGAGTELGGLVGSNSGTVTASYWDTESSGQTTSAGGTGKTGVELRAPTGYTGIYANWNLGPGQRR